MHIFDGSEHSHSDMLRFGWRHVKTFSGPPGSGKTTRVKKLAADYEAKGFETADLVQWPQGQQPSDNLYVRPRRRGGG
ncbi:hypothetical protein AncyloWKF20_05595 [Ancylobacter sp. WKF20]|uniref:hypothetical protein n=1 Tax=Ancylobacter sp. WKF20 TaxID=3039801 RepID=UPI0024345FF4|nr:hypothetical protein [Ancylobacter sp. WKF20]WGD31299.1 hypothetical protein AncyloWKF20_05595 [Ancylobacter sp. WKF20]